MNTALKVCYDGTDFNGWQVQDNGRTVQGELERAIEQRFGFFARITGSGRTDAGVHAAAQICNFAMDDSIQIPPERIADALNTLLPSDLRVLQSARVEESFDSCRSALKKTYRYSIYLSKREVPLLERYALCVDPRVDIAKMKSCASLLEGEHDFVAFSATGSSAKTTVRTVHCISLNEQTVYGVPCLNIDVCGNGFLYNMVRIIVGTMLGFGYGKISESDVCAALKTGNRELLGRTVAAKGLTLLNVAYATDIFG